MEMKLRGEQASRRADEQQWLWFVCLLMLVAFVVLGVAARRVGSFEVDVRFARWLQGIDWRVFRWATDLTNWAMNTVPLTVAAICFSLYLLWRRRPTDAAVLAIATALRLLNGLFKRLIESPRPTPDLLDVVGNQTSFGYPSGHAAGALLVVGAFAWSLSRHASTTARRWLVWVIAVAWIVLTGLGRVYAGRHWPTDVVGAWLWTIPALTGVIWLATRQESRRRDGA
jgi:membrane-associated phospholipid phosphatase